MPRGDPVHGVGIVRDLDVPNRQLLAKSYRPRPAAQQRTRRLGKPLGELLRAAQLRPPEALARRRVERRADLAAARVLDDEALALASRRGETAGEGVERADAADRQAAAQRQAAGGGDADPQAGEGAGPDSDRDPLDPLPAAGRRRGPLDLLEQRRRVQRAVLVGESDQLLVEDLAVARGAGRGVAGGGVEADYGQRSGTTKSKEPTCLPWTNQVTVCLPGMLVVIRLT